MVDFKANFKNKYDKNEVSNEQLLCPLCNNHIDNEENLLLCSELVNNSKVKYSDIFSKDMNILTKATKQFQKLWKMRQRNLKVNWNWTISNLQIGPFAHLYTVWHCY